LDPFLWEHGRMIDLGSLGGTIGFAQCANNRGEIIGFSNLSGDTTTHAFFRDDGSMKDLGTLGGNNSEAIWINDAGEIAGSADLPGSVLSDHGMDLLSPPLIEVDADGRITQIG
jgi:probable HAF family extracellular repeat protein